MGLTFYDLAPTPANEQARELAVKAANLLHIRQNPDLQVFVEQARKCFGTSMAAISIVYQESQYLIATTGLPSGIYSRKTSFCGHGICSDKAIFEVTDADADIRFAGNPIVHQDRMVRYYAAAALRGSVNLPVGALCVFDPKPRTTMPQWQAAALIKLAKQVSMKLGL